MPSLKMKIKEYNGKFEGVPSDEDGRLVYLLNKLKFKQSEFEFLDKIYEQFKKQKTETYRFILYLNPEPSPRPRVGRANRFYVRGAKENNDLFFEILSSLEPLPIITTATEVKLVSYLPMPSAMNRYERFFAELGYIKPLAVPDWDNLAKTYTDMVQKGLILNDSLIWKGESIKFYSVKPRIDLSITYTKSYDCTYNRKHVEKSQFYLAEDKDRFDSSLRTVLSLNK